MKKIQHRKLQLRTETLKTLDDRQLAQAAGGGWNVTLSCARAACTQP
jgi:hypothetical protein